MASGERTDPNVMTCHWCKRIKVDPDSSGLWWRLNGYHKMFSGLACFQCMDNLAAIPDWAITACLVEKELTR